MISRWPFLPWPSSILLREGSSGRPAGRLAVTRRFERRGRQRRRDSESPLQGVSVPSAGSSDVLSEPRTQRVFERSKRPQRVAAYSAPLRGGSDSQHLVGP